MSLDQQIKQKVAYLRHVKELEQAHKLPPALWRKKPLAEMIERVTEQRIREARSR